MVSKTENAPSIVILYASTTPSEYSLGSCDSDSASSARIQGWIMSLHVVKPARTVEKR